MELDESVLKEFADETLKNLEAVGMDLSRSARTGVPPDEKQIRDIRRVFHSVKGCAGFFPLPDLEKLARAMEDLLTAVLEKRSGGETAVWERLSEGAQMIRLMLENTDKKDGYPVDPLCGALAELIGTAEGETEVSAASAEDGIPEVSDGREEMEVCFEISPATLRKLPAMHEYLYVLAYDLADYAFREGKSPVALVRELMSVGLIVDAEIRSLAKDLDDNLQEEVFWYIVLYSTILGKEFIDAAVGLPPDRIFPADREKLGDTDVIVYRIRSKTLSLIAHPPGIGSPEREKTDEHPGAPIPPDRVYGNHPEENEESFAEKPAVIHPETVFRQDVSANAEHRPDAEGGECGEWASEQESAPLDRKKLDHLVNLVGELVIAESMVTKNPDLKGLRLDRFERSAHNLRRIISEIQNTAMSVQMFSFAGLFTRTVRMVRDLSAGQGKQIQVKLEGQETGTDRSILAQIAEPLMHMVRYAVICGIESPEQRKSAGKSETGLIALSVRQEGGDILLAVSDNGRGLNRNEILGQAVRKGIVGDGGTDLRYEEVCRLIFEPALYGDGETEAFSRKNAFLPLIKRIAEKLKGRAEVRSIPGEGTLFSLRIPIPLAIMDGMLVRVGSTFCTVPLLSIRESFRAETKQITVTMSGQELIRVRNHLLPVIRLHRIYGIVPEQEKLEQGILITVVSGERKVCLFADEIIGHHQTVVKQMPEYLGNAACISGCTILENGGVGFILDIGSLMDRAEVRGNASLHPNREDSRPKTQPDRLLPGAQT
ncbi:MAG: chemotaxis protein CheW [Desulfobacterales bacterium]